MDPIDVISISDTDSNASSIVLVKGPLNELKRVPILNSNQQSSISQNNEEVEVVTLSSVSQKSTERCPVTWTKSPKKPDFNILNADTFYSPSPKAKVTHWLSENANNNKLSSHRSVQQQISEAEAQLNIKESPIDSLTSFSTNKSSILVRQDYKKSDFSDIQFGSRNSSSLNTSGNSRIIYLENNKSEKVYEKLMIVGDYNTLCNRTTTDLVQKSVTIKGNNNQQQTLDSEQSDVDIERIPKSTPLSMKSLVESIPALCGETDNNDDNNRSKVRFKTYQSKIPLSPDTQKKIELCQYLKLMNMNPSDTRTSELTQNRRSTRVKHLALLSEKRELERKLNSETQEIEKKKIIKSTDADSRHSSDNDRGSKMSKKSNTSTDSSNTSKISTEFRSSVQKVILEENNSNKSSTKAIERRRNSVKTPSKFLQVPEVSTTSMPRDKNLLKEHNYTVSNVQFRKSDSDIIHNHKNNSSSNSCKSEIITKKSFEQLKMNVESLKSLRNMRSQSINTFQESNNSENIFLFAKSVANIPNIRCDFDETIKIILNQEIAKIVSPPVGETRNIKISTNITDENNFKIPKRKILQKRKAKISNNFPKSKVPKLNGNVNKKKLKEKQLIKTTKSNNFNKPNTRRSKTLRPRKKYKNSQHINRLRSKGRSKQIKLKKLLLKDRQKKKKVTKKKLKSKLNFMHQKDFKTAELIQHGKENNSNTTKELIKPPLENTEKPENSPNKIKKRLPEAEVWKKYFTSEHRRAYIESIKYLEEEEKNAKKAAPTKKEEAVVKEVLKEKTEESPPCYGFKPTEIKTDEIRKLEKTCEIIKNSITPLPIIVNTISNNGSYPEKNQPSSEDLEVDQLMSCKKMKDQATQKDCESPEAERDTLQTDLTDPALADHSRCTSSTNSWSLQTVESHPDATTSNSKQDMIEIPCRSSNNSTEIQLNETSNRNSATPPSPDANTSSPIIVGHPEIVNISQIQPTTCTYVNLPSNGTEVKSLHHSLTQPKIKLRDKSRNSSPINQQQNWEESLGIVKSPKTDRRTSQSHIISLSNTNGAVMSAYYLDFNIIIVQELMVSFWNQSPLGNVLGAQDMWIPKGNTRRMVLGNGCVHKESSETVISFDNTVAYIELWTKEHKSDKRERPVADIFIAIYLRLSRNVPDKKVLQLENIHGYANDVQYIVLRNARSIIVSWNVIADGVSSTLVHCYYLSPDYQTVTSITKMETVSHYVSSLHNIEDCDTLILGCGDFKITLWDLEHGYVVATIDLIEIHPQPRTVWAKRDRGFLFTLHHFSDGVLQLIAINSFDSTWKRLQTYKPELDYESLLGVCMENGLLVAFYDTGVACWSAQTGIPILEDTSEDSGVLLPYGKHVVVVLKNQVHVRHALEYLITICPMEDS